MGYLLQQRIRWFSPQLTVRPLQCPSQIFFVAEQAEPLVIEIPEPATKGTITIYTPDGAVYGYYGEITINSDGSTGQDIDIVCAGYLEGFLEHGEPEYTEESEDSRNE